VKLHSKPTTVSELRIALIGKLWDRVPGGPVEKPAPSFSKSSTEYVKVVEDIPSIYCKLRLTKKFYTMFAQTACENLFTLRAKCFISNTVIFNDLQ